MALEVSKYPMHGRSIVTCRPSQTAIQNIYHPESKLVGLQVCSVNVGTLRRDCIHVEMQSTDICCVQVTRLGEN